jgi:glycosyltransferase involved in cell wall biosynthesis
MNILFLTLSSIKGLDEHSLYTDMLRDLRNRGHRIFIIRPEERKYHRPTRLIKGDGYELLALRTLNIQKTNVVEKGIATLSLEWLFNRAIRKYWGKVKFDLVIYTTPPITFNQVIADVKARCGARSYLLLKDIFPQNAVDLGMMKEGSLLHRMFRRKEERLYALSDRIGCMSPANVQFVLDHNPEVDPRKVELAPNSLELKDVPLLSAEEKEAIRGKLGIPQGKTLFIYGGNLGKPQGIDFLMRVIAANEERKDSFIMVVGSGTEFGKIQSWFEEHRPVNAKLMSALPKEDYDNLVKAADVGLIFLDPRFTIPNYPSRLLSYMEIKVPVLMATDVNTDVGPIAEANGYGMWSESGDLEAFMKHLDLLAKDADLRSRMGEKGYEFLCKNYLVEHTVEPILRAMNVSL